MCSMLYSIGRFMCFSIFCLSILISRKGGSPKNHANQPFFFFFRRGVVSIAWGLIGYQMFLISILYFVYIKRYVRRKSILYIEYIMDSNDDHTLDDSNTNTDESMPDGTDISDGADTPPIWLDDVYEPEMEIYGEPPNRPEQTVDPKIVFVVPYRDRQEHLSYFAKHMAQILSDIPKKDYKILLVHQNDKRGFNRGAIKNIGFMYVRHLYPATYQTMTIVFNDVDTMPRKKGYVDYNTKPGVIRHYCGFTFTLGGIVCINAGDFEKLNGFPNLWAWGFEDNMLQHRANAAGIQIDRSVFCDYKTDGANNEHFISLYSGDIRTVNQAEFSRYMRGTREGINTIGQIMYTNTWAEMGIPAIENMMVLNVNTFNTGVNENVEQRKDHSLQKSIFPFGKVIYRRGGGGTMSMVM